MAKLAGDTGAYRWAIPLELFVFSVLVAVFWANNELLGFSAALVGGEHRGNWHEALIETTFAATATAVVLGVTVRMRNRLTHFQQFLRICAWCKKVNCDEDWVSLDDYLRDRHNLLSTHGICPMCYETTKAELNNRKRRGATEPVI